MNLVNRTYLLRQSFALPLQFTLMRGNLVERALEFLAKNRRKDVIARKRSDRSPDLSGPRSFSRFSIGTRNDRRCSKSKKFSASEPNSEHTFLSDEQTIFQFQMLNFSTFLPAKTISKTICVTTIAVNMLINIPKERVTAKPFTGPVPN